MKKLLPYSIIVIAFAVLAISYLPSITSRNSKLPYETPTFTPAPETQSAGSTLSTDSTGSPQASSPQASPASPSVNSGQATSTPSITIPVTLKVRTQTYSADVPPGSTVLDVMNHFASRSSFRFHSTYYPSLGHFINEINSAKNTSDAFWIYYVNGKQANVGISVYQLKPNDTIHWKLEDINKNEVN